MFVNEKHSPSPMKQVESGEVPSDSLSDLYSVSDGVVLCWHKDLSDKENLSQQENGPVHHGDYDVHGERGVPGMVRVVISKWVSTGKVFERIVSGDQP